MNPLIEIGDFVLTAVLNTWPAFVISILLSVLVHSLKLDGAIRRAFQANVGLAIILATLVGAFSPFCSCTVVPIIAGLLASGVPLAPVMAFWIASPTMDPEIFALSVGIIGWPLALARLGATLALSLGAGFITLALTKRFGLAFDRSDKRGGIEKPNWNLSQTGREGALNLSFTSLPLAIAPLSVSPVMSSGGIAVLENKEDNVNSCSSGSCQIPQKPNTDSWWAQIKQSFQEINWKVFGRETLELTWSLGRWLLLAFVLEAIITSYVPQEAIAAVVGGENWYAVPLAAFIGIPLYLNNLAALPIVSGLLEQGMQSGAAIAFLIAGPVTTIPAMTAVWGIVSRKIFALYLGLGLVGAIFLGLLVNLLGF